MTIRDSGVALVQDMAQAGLRTRWWSGCEDSSPLGSGSMIRCCMLPRNPDRPASTTNSSRSRSPGSSLQCARLAGGISDAESAVRALDAVARPALAALARLLLWTESIASSEVEEMRIGVRELASAVSSRPRCGGIRDWRIGNVRWATPLLGRAVLILREAIRNWRGCSSHSRAQCPCAGTPHDLQRRHSARACRYGVLRPFSCGVAQVGNRGGRDATWQSA